jgi:hypothetical protein
MQRRSCFILACLQLALPCIASDGDEAPSPKELSNVFIGMRLDEGTKLLKSLGKELFTEGVNLKYNEDGSIEQSFGAVSAGWKVGDVAVVELSGGADGRVTGISLSDARMYGKSRMPSPVAKSPSRPSSSSGTNW